MQITVANRGPQAADLHVLPTLWCRNDWALWLAKRVEKPLLKQIDGPAGTTAVVKSTPESGSGSFLTVWDGQRRWPIFPMSSSTR